MNAKMQELIEAMDQVLDDMGKTGQGVCLHTKAKARIAWEPFRECSDADADEFLMTLAEAKNIVDEVERS